MLLSIRPAERAAAISSWWPAMTALSPGNVCLQLPADPRDWAIRFLERQGLTVSSITRIGGGAPGGGFPLVAHYKSPPGPAFVGEAFVRSPQDFMAGGVPNELPVPWPLAAGGPPRPPP